MMHRSTPSQALSCSLLLIEGGSCSVVVLQSTLFFFLAHLRHPNGNSVEMVVVSLLINDSPVDYLSFGIQFLAETFGKWKGLGSEALAGDAP